jgi:integrase/recombinase XerD
VPFGVTTAQAVDRYLRVRREQRWASKSALWLAERNRGAVGADGIKQMLSRRGQALGVRVHAHMFRHGFADAWLRQGGSEGDLQELAGWKSRTMVARYGAANRASRARDAYRRLSPMDNLP